MEYQKTIKKPSAAGGFHNFAFCLLIFTFICSTLVKNILQIDPFMQNKPNFPDAKINLSPYIAKDYENKPPFRPRENKPNSNPIKANFKKAEMNVSIVYTKDYRKYGAFAVQKNKPNFKLARKIKNVIILHGDFRDKEL